MYNGTTTAGGEYQMQKRLKMKLEYERLRERAEKAEAKTARFRAALFCEECNTKRYEIIFYNRFACRYQREIFKAGRGVTAIRKFYRRYPRGTYFTCIEGVYSIDPCPTCGPLREQLRPERTELESARDEFNLLTEGD